MHLSVDLPKTSESFWLASTPQTNYRQLDKEIKVDVAVIGGGLAGISTAWLLKGEGLTVAVMEADRLCQGTTAYSTAKITSQHNLIYAQIKDQFGEELARQYAQANEQALKFMGETIRELHIQCDYLEQPAFVYTQQDRYVQKIQQEAEVAQSLGIRASYHQSLDLPFRVKAAVAFEGQAQFHPRRYVLALAERVEGEGSFIFEQTRAVGIDEGSPKVIYTKQGHRISADHVVVASHFPFHDGLGLYFARMYPDRSYILAVRTEDKLAPGMYVTVESPGRSLRTFHLEKGEGILLAGESHKTGHGENMATHYQALGEFAAEIFSQPEILYRWSAQDYTTIDKIPYIGKIRSGAENIYVATGFRKWGISSSTVSALLLRDLIVKGESPWQDVYSPSRGLKLSSAGQLVQQNLHVANLLVSGKLQKPVAGEEVRPGEGKLVQLDGHKVGAYRDEEGKLHLVDITCTHMGCELKWNNGEKSWDCPCHGSRFTYEGDVLEGPAINPLHHLTQGPNDIDPDII